MKNKKLQKRPPARARQKSGKYEKKHPGKSRIRITPAAVAVVCAIALAVWGFYAARYVFFGEIDSPAVSLADEPPETAPANDPSGSEQKISEPGVSNRATGTAYRPSTAPAVSRIPPEHKFLILVIDDAGNNLRELEPFLQFPGPITISVLPRLADSAEAARRVRAAGKELFLHQPMEPLKSRNPAPGTIRTGMSHAEIREIIAANLNEIGPVAGMNNHEGSRATADPEIMRSILELCLNEGIYFLDSRTTADTATRSVARELDMNIIQRDVFLDNKQDRESILAALEAGCRRAEQNGSAVLIGHAWSRQLAAILIEMYPRLIERGFAFVNAETYMNSTKRR